MDKLIIILQTLNPNRQRFAKPYDSTIGVGSGFGWFAGAILVFIVIGVIKAFWDDKEWRGRMLTPNKRPMDLKYRSGQWIEKEKLHASTRSINFKD